MPDQVFLGFFLNPLCLKIQFISRGFEHCMSRDSVSCKNHGYCCFELSEELLTRTPDHSLVLYLPLLRHLGTFIHHELQEDIAGIFPSFILNISANFLWIAEIEVA